MILDKLVDFRGFTGRVELKDDGTFRLLVQRRQYIDSVKFYAEGGALSEAHSLATDCQYCVERLDNVKKRENWCVCCPFAAERMHDNPKLAVVCPRCGSISCPTCSDNPNECLICGAIRS